MSRKNLGLQFLPYKPGTDKIVGFLKVLYLKNELMYEADFLYVIN